MILRWLGQRRAQDAQDAQAHYNRALAASRAAADEARIHDLENSLLAMRLNRDTLAGSLNACRYARDFLEKEVATITAERDELQLRVQSLTETIAMMERADDAASF